MLKILRDIHGGEKSGASTGKSEETRIREAFGARIRLERPGEDETQEVTSWVNIIGFR
jgi:hypothetical protein